LLLSPPSLSSCHHHYLFDDSTYDDLTHVTNISIIAILFVSLIKGHNDVKNIKKYLIGKQGFLEKDMLILMDDGNHHDPTRQNIMQAFDRITQYSKAGDVVFIHYSGHGGRVRDTSGDEDDGYDETLIPLDFKKSGQIVDDEIYERLVKKMPADVTVVCLMDSCHSGTALDLPYEINATESKMRLNQGFNMGLLQNPAMVAGCCLFLLMSLMDG
jgi:hypothetical protein